MMNSKHSIITSVIWTCSLVFLFQSCFVAKKYERPESITTPDNYRDQETTDTTNIAQLSILDFFPDTILQGYFQKALENNKDILTALHQISIAESYLKQGKAGYLPQLNANAQYSVQRFSSGGTVGQYLSNLEQYDLSGSLSWEADIWGKIRSQKRASLADYLQSKQLYHAVRSKVIAKLATSYYELMALQEKLILTREAIELRKKSYIFNQELKDAGLQNQVVVEKAKALLLQATALEKMTLNQIELQENAICILLGEYPHAILIAEDFEIPLDTLLNVGVPFQLLRQRPDVSAAEYQLMSAFEMTNKARASFYPSFKITVMSGYQNNQFAQWFSPGSYFYNIVGGLSQPILNQRSIRTQYEVAKSKEVQATLNFELSLLNAYTEVSNAITNHETARSLVETKTEELAAYEQIIDQSDNLFRSGLINALDVLNTQEDALNTALDLVDQENAQQNSIIELYRALGGGIK